MSSIQSHDEVSSEQLMAALERVNVVGTSGSGKSTFSKKLAKILQQPYVEMGRQLQPHGTN